MRIQTKWKDRFQTSAVVSYPVWLRGSRKKKETNTDEGEKRFRINISIVKATYIDNMIPIVLNHMYT